MRDSYTGTTYSASSPNNGPNSIASTPSPGGAYAQALPSPGFASAIPAPPTSLHIQTENLASPIVPIVPDRMIVEGREQDSGMSFEDAAPAPVAPSLPPSYEQASERPRAPTDQ